MPARPLPLLLVLLALPACLAPEAPPPLRHFEPLLTEPDAAPAADPAPLRLRAAQASAHLDTRMLYRLSEVETGHHETLRWTDRPARFLDLALAGALFESGRFHRSLATGTPVLSVDLLAFEELRDADGGARLELRAVLEDADGRALFERRYLASAERADGPEQVARALGLLLAQEADAVARDVAAALAER